VQIPEPFQSAADAVLVVRYTAPGLGTFEATRPLAELPEKKAEPEPEK
jgi:hypothetical protein